MMQIKIFSIPTYGGEGLNEEMNRFLRSKKVLSVDSVLVATGGSSYWSFCVRYIEGAKATSFPKARIDYKDVLDAESYQRYKAFREIRKSVAKEEGVPAYLVLTNEEMAELAKIKGLTLKKMEHIKGIGQKKVEKYGSYFVKEEDLI